MIYIPSPFEDAFKELELTHAALFIAKIDNGLDYIELYLN